MRQAKLLIPLLLFICAAGAVAEDKPVKFAAVDVEAVVAKSKMGAALSARVRDYVAQRNTELQAMQKDLQDRLRALNQQKGVLSDQDYANQKTELDKRNLDFQNRQASARSEIVKFNRAQLESFTAALTPIIEKIGAERGCTIIFNADLSAQITLRRSAVLYVEGALDLTAEVISRLDALSASGQKQ